MSDVFLPGTRPVVPPPSKFDRPHAAFRVIVAAVGWLAGSVFAAALAVALMTHVAGFWRGEDDAAIALAAMAGTEATLFGVAWAKARRVGFGSRVVGLGLMPIRRRGLIAIVLSLNVVWVCAAFAMVLLTDAAKWLPDTSSADSVNQIEAATVPIKLGFAALVVFVAPVAEELFFRGWLWSGLRRRWGVLPTAFVTALLFLAAHMTEVVSKPLFLLPSVVALTLARHYGGSVKASIAVHIANNGTVAAIAAAAMLAG